MTLSSTTTKVTYNGDGATTDFAIGFVFWDSDDLRVIHRDSSGAEIVWTRGTQYTVTGGAGATGTLTVRTLPTDYTPAAGETLTIKDSQSETQGDSLPLSGAFPSTVVEQRLDKITRLIQIHSEEIARAVLLPETASLSSLKIPEPGAGELVRYNPAGTNLETVAVASLAISALDTLLTGLATNDFLRWDNAQSAWVNIAPGATGLALLQNATATAARAELGLGTAAVANTGVANGNVPAMDATGYPAADGSRITNLAPRGYTDGLMLSNNISDAAHGIDIAAGVARDKTNAATLLLAAAQTKQLDARWASGDAAGGLANAALISANVAVSFDNATSKILGTGLFGGAGAGDTIIVSGSASNDGLFEVAAATADDATLSVAPVTEAAGNTITVYIVKANWLYNVFIADDGSGGAEIGFDDSLTAANFLALAGVGPTYRAIGYVETDATANISAVAWVGDLVRYRWFFPAGTTNIDFTYIKPAMLHSIERVEGVSGGGGGEAGVLLGVGGDAGGPGIYGLRTGISAALIGATEIGGAGGGGAGGAGVAGADGSPGGDSFLGSLLILTGGGGGAVGTGADGTSTGHDYIAASNAVGLRGGYGGGGAGGTGGGLPSSGSAGGPGWLLIVERFA